MKTSKSSLAHDDAIPHPPSFTQLRPALSSVRVLIVDDHAVMRGGLQAMLSLSRDIEEVATACGGEEALALCASFQPNVILMDLRMPGMDGQSAIRAICRSWPQIRIIVLTGNETIADMKLAKQNGAVGFLSKSAEPSMLLKVIATIAAGGTSFPTQVADPIHDTGITARELELLQQLARGLSNEEIGSALGITGQTVKGYLKLLFPKLGAANRAEAVNRAHQLNLI